MGIFSRFENRMEDTFEGAADKMSNAPISPVQIAKKAEKQMRRGKMVGAGKQYAPTLYTVLVNPDDDERLFGYYPTLAGETETYLNAKAAEEGLIMDGHPLVRFVVDDTLKHGKFDIIAEAVAAPIVEQLRDEEMARYGIGGKAAYERQMASAAPRPVHDEYDELADFEPQPGHKPPLPYVPEDELDRSIDYGEYTFNSEDFEDYRAKAEAAGEEVLDFGNADSQPLGDYGVQRSFNKSLEIQEFDEMPLYDDEPVREEMPPYNQEPAFEQKPAYNRAQDEYPLKRDSLPLVSQPLQPEPQPAYQQPAYQQAPAYEQAYAPAPAAAPAYQQQPYQQQAYQQPAYQQQAYQQQYQQPAYQQAYQQPAYQQPAYQPEPQPAYQTPNTVVFAQGAGANVAAGTIPTQQGRARLIDIAYRRAYDLAGTHITIGRETSNDIVVQDINASRRHAEMRLTAQGYWVITDLRSMNGTLVNGIPVASQALNPGDRLTIGKTEFEFTLR